VLRIEIAPRPRSAYGRRRRTIARPAKCRLQIGHHGIQGGAASGAPPHSRPARSDVGKVVVARSCQTRINNCANCRPVVPVCERSSGNAFCSSSCENRKCRFQRAGLETPPFACAEGFDLGVFVEKPACVLLENARQHVQHVGRRACVCRFHHAEIGTRTGAAAASICTQAGGKFHRRVRPLRLREGAQLGSQKMPLSDQSHKSFQAASRQDLRGRCDPVLSCSLREH